MTDSVKTVVFDFDHTLTSWDTANQFFRWLLRRRLWRMALVAIAFPMLGPLMCFDRTRRFPVRYAIWVATLGLSAETLQTLVKQHVQSVSSDGRPLLRDGIDRLLQHQAEGYRVVIATGSLEILAKEFLSQHGLGEIPLVGSSLKPMLWGMVSKQHCFGDRKIPMLAERGFPPPWAVTYTDHQCDLPVLGLAKECYLVNPKPEAIRIITRGLSFTPAILSWR